MSEVERRGRNLETTMPIPVPGNATGEANQADGQPSLIPPDVWQSYQEEIATAEREAMERQVRAVAAEPTLVSDEEVFDAMEFSDGLGVDLSSGAADLAIARTALERVDLFKDLSGV